MIGFEVEIDLPVTDASGQKFPGDKNLAVGNDNDFTLVSDTRSLPNGAGKYSNLEFVTAAVPAIGAAYATGSATLQDVLVKIRTVRTDLYNAGAAPLSGASGLLTMLPDGPGALLAPNNGYVERAGTAGCGDALYPHYSVGVPLAGMPTFFSRLRAAAPHDEGAYLRHPRFRLSQADAFAQRVVSNFQRSPFHDNAPATERALNGYLQLAFTQVTAMADCLAKGTGQIKNATVVLSRSALGDAYALLPGSAQKFLADGHDGLVTVLAEYQERTLTGEKLEFREKDYRLIVRNYKISLIDYAKAAFQGAPKVDQEVVFGGMREIAPHSEGNATLIPMEIRTMGVKLKTWHQVSDDLAHLFAWAEEAYRDSKKV